MPSLPARGAAVRRLGLALPPDRMPLVHDGRPLKRWRYVGVFGPDVMLCVGHARVGGVPRRWWAVAEPGGALLERTTAGRGGVTIVPTRVSVRTRAVSLDLELEHPASGAVEVVSPHGGSYIWTRKQVVHARGDVEMGGRRIRVDGGAFVDESAGYHERRTAWRWSAGLGRGADGAQLAWNLVSGVHDDPEVSERTVWVDGEPRHVGPQDFAADLAGVGGLAFSEWCAREDRTNLLLFRSRYRQPFGEFTGELPGGLRLAEGYGVMEEHDVRW